MKKLIFVALAAAGFLGLHSCTKPGLGGDATIVAFPKHHNKSIYGATVYVKFDTKDSPGSSTDSYDASFQGNANEDHIHVEGLKKGDYYFYVIGYDSAISLPVYGGQPVSISNSNKSDEQDVEIAVTE